MGLFGKNKNSIKKNLVRILLIKTVIVIVIVVSVILSLSSFWFILKKDTVEGISTEIRDNEENENGEGGKVNEDIKIDLENRQYVIDEKFKQKVEEVIEKLKINSNSVGLTEELLTKMYAAEVMTLYPDIRERDKIGTKFEKDEMQGCVQFRRTYEDGTQELLEYMPFDEYRVELAKFGRLLEDKDGNTVSQEQIYFSKGEVKEKYKELRRYYTLDEEYNVITATLSSNEIITTYSDYAKEEGQEDKYEFTYYVKETSKNYMTPIKKYSMPLEFTLAMLAISENPGFCEKLLELIEDTKIIVEFFDNTSVSNIVQKYDYEANFEMEKRVHYLEQVNKNTVELKEKVETAWYTKEKDMSNPYRKVTKNLENINTIVDVVEAKTWMADTKITYEKTAEPNDTRNETPMEDDVEYLQVEDYHNLLSWVKDIEIKETDKINRVTKKQAVYEKKINKETTTQMRASSIKYSEVSEEVTEKEERFLSLLSVDPTTGVFDKEDIGKNTKLMKYKDVYGKESSPEKNILISKYILFDILGSNRHTQALEETMRYLLYIYTGTSYGVTEFNFDIYIPDDFTTIGASLSPFGTNLTRQEFINVATAASNKYGSDYVEYMVKYAGVFYDVCEEYNINPALAFAHSCIETKYGSSAGCKEDKNYFGYAHYNTSSSGKAYETPRESIEDYCKWIKNRTNPKTSDYVEALARGQEFSTVNSKFKGTPDTNIYVMYCTYEFLGHTHLSDEPDFSNPAGQAYYEANGSDWGTGGRIYIYDMYEDGGICFGEYAIRCGHKNAEDPTTIAERADYSMYKTNQKLTIAREIFGNGCILGAAGSIVESAYQVADHFLNSGVEVHYGGDSVYTDAADAYKRNGRVCVFDNIQGAWDYPVQNPERYGVVCATYVALALWNAGIVEEDVVNNYGYNSCDGLRNMFDNAYKDQFQKVLDFSELQEGDIVFEPEHVLIYVEDGKCIDQSYCVTSSATPDVKASKTLVNIDIADFVIAYRYVGN